ncbi:MAG: hypothetical protein A3K65_00355 [Euryarchaeota archaeon RBG_16_68_12]|nr:MAG: hypothetical protein A3K65_00355 [Euryarchaeota archaeon RBG_16_68_12]
MEATDPLLAWLLEPSQPAMRYLTSRDLVRPRPSERALARLRAAIPGAGWASRILDRQKEKTWWATKKTCYGPKFQSTIWQLQVLADLGMSRRDERIANAIELWFHLHMAKDGGYSPWSRREATEYARIHFRHPGTFLKRGHLCTTGNMVRSLIRLGYLDDERVRSAIRWLVDEQYPSGGWDCFGRRNATMDAWEAMSGLAEVPPSRRSPDVRRALEAGAEFFLRRRLLHEGPRFERWYWLRYPWHYHYDVLVGLDFTTALGHGKDPRMREALDHLESKRLPDGRWKLDHTNGNLVIESRGRPSKMVTFLALRALKRAGRPTSRVSPSGAGTRRRTSRTAPSGS